MTKERRVFDHQHGQINNTCADPACQAAASRRRKQWQLDRHRGVTATTSDSAVLENVRLHILTLQGAGWSRRAISAAAGLSPSAVSRIANQQQNHIRWTTVAAIHGINPSTVPTKASTSTTEPFVSRVGTVRRVQALLAIGWTHQLITEHAGVKSAVLLSQQGRWVTRTSHDKIAATYRALATRPGPSNLTRGRAASLGYLSPVAWSDPDTDPEPDTEDSPLEVPTYDEVSVTRALDGRPPVDLTQADRIEIVRRGRAHGRSYRDLEAHAGISKPERYIQTPAAGAEGEAARQPATTTREDAA